VAGRTFKVDVSEWNVGHVIPDSTRQYGVGIVRDGSLLAMPDLCNETHKHTHVSATLKFLCPHSHSIPLSPTVDHE